MRSRPSALHTQTQLKPKMTRGWSVFFVTAPPRVHRTRAKTAARPSGPSAVASGSSHGLRCRRTLQHAPRAPQLTESQQSAAQLATSNPDTRRACSPRSGAALPPKRGYYSMTDAERKALLDALRASTRLCTPNGVIAAYASPERGQLIAENTAAHRVRRDSTIDALTHGRSRRAPAGCRLHVPFPVSDPSRRPGWPLPSKPIPGRVAVGGRRGESAPIRRIGVDTLTAMRCAPCLLGNPSWAPTCGRSAFPGKT